MSESGEARAGVGLAGVVEALSQSDSIMQPGIINSLVSFLTLGGKPAEAIQHLSHAYEGYAEMCNLLLRWHELTGGHAGALQLLTEGFVRELALHHFDPVKADAILTGAYEAPAWLSELILAPSNRALVYTLSRKHRQCELLNFTIQLISEAGHHMEIASLESASLYFASFSRVLSGVLREMLHARDLSHFEAFLPDFLELCTHSQHTYLYALAALQRIEERSQTGPQADLLARMRQEVVRAAQSKAEKRSMAQKLELLFVGLEEQPPDLVNALTALVTRKELDQSQLSKLKRLYYPLGTSERPPARFVQRLELFEFLVTKLFTPSSLSGPFRADAVAMLAYASAAPPDAPPNTAELDRINTTADALAEVFPVCQNHYIGSELQHAASVLLPHLIHPAVAVGVVRWLRAPLTDADWYLLKINTQSIPLSLGILQEIAFLHAALRPVVVALIAECIELRTDLDAMATFDVQKTYLDALAVCLVEMGALAPVMSAFARWRDGGLDQALLRHFILTVLHSVAAPYSADFAHAMLAAAASLTEQSLAVPDFQAALKIFISQVKAQRSLGTDVAALVRDLETRYAPKPVETKPASATSAAPVTASSVVKAEVTAEEEKPRRSALTLKIKPFAKVEPEPDVKKTYQTRSRGGAAEAERLDEVEDAAPRPSKLALRLPSVPAPASSNKLPSKLAVKLKLKPGPTPTKRVSRSTRGTSTKKRTKRKRGTEDEDEEDEYELDGDDEFDEDMEQDWVTGEDRDFVVKDVGRSTRKTMRTRHAGKRRRYGSASSSSVSSDSSDEMDMEQELRNLL